MRKPRAEMEPVMHPNERRQRIFRENSKRALNLLFSVEDVEHVEIMSDLTT
jgi:hypothetical protein